MPSAPVRLLMSEVCSAIVADSPRAAERFLGNPLVSELERAVDPVSVLKSETCFPRVETEPRVADSA